MKQTLAERLDASTHVVLKFGTGVLTEHIEKRSNRYFRQIAKECLELKKTRQEGHHCFIGGRWFWPGDSQTAKGAAVAAGFGG